MQQVRVLGLDNDKQAFEDFKAQLKTQPLVVGTQVFREGRMSQHEKTEMLILENPDNSDCDKAVVCNTKSESIQTQIIVGFTNCNLSAVPYEAITAEVVKIANERGILKTQLVQPTPPQVMPVFDFENERYKGTPYFLLNGALVERANADIPIEPTKAQNIAFVTLNFQDESFERRVQQLVALQKRFDQLVMFTMISDLRPDSYSEIVQRSPFTSQLNLVFDTLGRRRFTFAITEGKAKKYQLLVKGESIDDLYQNLLDILSGGNETKPCPEDCELIIKEAALKDTGIKEGAGCIFQGIPLYYENIDIIAKPIEKQEEKQEKVKRRLRDIATSKETVEEDEEEKKDGDAPPADNKDDGKPEDDKPEGEPRRDPLNTYVFAFWNPRHRDFESKIKQFVSLAYPENIQRLREDKVEGAPEEARVSEKADDKDKKVEEPETRPYLKLFTCIQGTRKITLSSFERKIGDLREYSKIILDDDWLYNKVQAMLLQERGTLEGNLGMFFVYNREFKQILEETDFDVVKAFVETRGQKKKRIAPVEQAK